MNQYLGLLEKALLDTLHSPAPGMSKGGQWPKRAVSMVSPDRMRNVRDLCEDVIERDVPGDFVECGVWRGGCAMMMAAVADGRRTSWACDSFEGLPRPSVKQDEGLNLWQYPALAVSEETVRENFRRFGVSTQRVNFLKGWFEDTLPTAPIEQISVLRCDGDMFKSTMDILVNLYPKVASGGYVIIDDYSDIPQCKLAVDTYRVEHDITAELETVDWTCVFWRKP